MAEIHIEGDRNQTKKVPFGQNSDLIDDWLSVTTARSLSRKKKPAGYMPSLDDAAGRLSSDSDNSTQDFSFVELQVIPDGLAIPALIKPPSSANISNSITPSEGIL